MINFIPIFPLNIVVFPGENLNLHIFEPRYQQLIIDCFKEKKPFGIPTVLAKGITDMGTLIEITEIVKLYNDGKMDITTRGLEVFTILEIVKNIPNKLYHGAIVNYPLNNKLPHPVMIKHLLQKISELHTLLHVSKKFTTNNENICSYDIAHHIGLSLDDEFRLLTLLNENQRLEFIKRHLKKTLPMVKGIELLKEKIKLNGHFKELKGFNFEQ